MFTLVCELECEAPKHIVQTLGNLESWTYCFILQHIYVSTKITTIGGIQGINTRWKVLLNSLKDLQDMVLQVKGNLKVNTRTI